MIKQFSTSALERVVRGFSCHRRIQIMDILSSSDKSLSLSKIAGICRIRLETASEHVRRLHGSGLVGKSKRGREVMHDLTPLGRKVLRFLKTL